MKKRSCFIFGAVLVTAAALVLGGCGGKDPAKIQAQLEKLQSEALEFAESGNTEKAEKLAAEAAKLTAQLEKALKKNGESQLEVLKKKLKELGKEIAKD
jgi:uncharacterized lipoprotein YmbA